MSALEGGTLGQRSAGSWLQAEAKAAERPEGTKSDKKPEPLTEIYSSSAAAQQTTMNFSRIKVPFAYPQIP